MENYDGVVVRFAEAVSEVSGVERDGVAFTTSTITIRDIDIMNVVHADRIVLRATSRQSIGESEGSMSYAGSRLDGLKVHGEPVDIAIERYGSISDSIVRSINLASLGTVNGYALPIDGVARSTSATTPRRRASGASP